MEQSNNKNDHVVQELRDQVQELELLTADLFDKTTAQNTLFNSMAGNKESCPKPRGPPAVSFAVDENPLDLLDSRAFRCSDIHERAQKLYAALGLAIVSAPNPTSQLTALASNINTAFLSIDRDMAHLRNTRRIHPQNSQHSRNTYAANSTNHHASDSVDSNGLPHFVDYGQLFRQMKDKLDAQALRIAHLESQTPQRLNQTPEISEAKIATFAADHATLPIEEGALLLPVIPERRTSISSDSSLKGPTSIEQEILRYRRRIAALSICRDNSDSAHLFQRN